MDDKTRFIKDPDAVLDYGFDWDDWLATAETISSTSWTVPSGITKDSDQYDDTTAKVWLSGGTVDTEYELTCQIATSGGRTDDRSFIIEVQER